MGHFFGDALYNHNLDITWAYWQHMVKVSPGKKRDFFWQKACTLFGKSVISRDVAKCALKSEKCHINMCTDRTIPRDLVSDICIGDDPHISRYR